MATSQLKTPFMLYREMCAEHETAHGDWETIGHEWKRNIPKGLKNRLMGEYIDSILLCAHATMTDPDSITYGRRVYGQSGVYVKPYMKSSRVQHTKTFKLVRIHPEEVQTCADLWVNVGEKEITIYNPSYEFYKNRSITESPRYTPIILCHPGDDTYWAIYITPKVRRMDGFDSCDVNGFLSIYTGAPPYFVYGTLTAKNVHHSY